MKTVAVLIVKNESKVIQRCLESLKDVVDSVILIDTGSTDDTIERAMTWRPELGKVGVYHQDWVDFGHNRTEAVRIAARHGDYILTIDADQTVEGTLPPDLTADAYTITVKFNNLEYPKPLLLKASLPWVYIGAVHEYLHCPTPYTPVTWPGLCLIEHADSHRRESGETKYRRDAEILEQQDLTLPRNVFYLARSYNDCGERDKAIEMFERRAKMGDYVEEVFYSLFQLGLIEQSVDRLLIAWDHSPHRWEPVYHACMLLNREGRFNLAYAVGKHVLKLKQPKEGLFLDNAIYDHYLLFEFSVSCYWTARYQEGSECCYRLLGKEIPEWMRKRTQENLSHFKHKLL